MSKDELVRPADRHPHINNSGLPLTALLLQEVQQFCAAQDIQVYCDLIQQEDLPTALFVSW